MMDLKKLAVLFLLFHGIVLLGQESSRVMLNGDWSFKIDPGYQGETLGWESEDYDVSCWDTMEVPGNWNLHNTYSEYTGDAWYTRTFKVDSSQKGRLIRLVFQSVYNDCKVWLNGHLLGENHFGYLPFEFDISKVIHLGEENRITVKVNNIYKNGAMWNWGGIRRPVWLEITAPLRIDYQHITALPDLKKWTATVQFKIVGTNATNTLKNITYQVILSKNGDRIAQKRVNAAIPANTNEYETFCSIQLSKSKVSLWHYDFPVLYDATVIMSEGMDTLHKMTDQFGIRKIEVSGDKVLLNGMPIRPVGFDIVPEDRVTGNTLPMDKIRADVDNMKQLGVVMARLTHVSLPKEYLDYLDKKGILTFSEVGLWGKNRLVDPDNPLPKEWLNRIIREKYNHPSVIGWSVGNEIGGVKSNPKSYDYIKGAIALAKKLDHNRLAVYVSHTAQNNPGDPVVFSDLAMINTYGGFERTVDRTWKYHNKPIFVSEFGSELNSEDPNLSQLNIDKMLDEMRDKPYVIGASLWCFNDYRSRYSSSPSWTTPLSQNRPWGIITSTGIRKRSFEEAQKAYAPIRNLELSDLDKEKGTAKITITPRAKYDIPANILKGFKVKWHLLNQDFLALKEDVKNLKTVYPGDSKFSFDIHLGPGALNAGGLVIELVDPQDYVVLNLKHYFMVPKHPKIKHVISATKGVRLNFDHVPGGEEYAISYKYQDTTITTGKTINNFIDVVDKQIKFGEDWSYSLIAYNNAGESIASSPIIAAKNENELPPIVWDAVRNNGNVYISFSVEPQDNMYEIEYGNTSGNYDRKLAFKVKGVVRLSNLQEGKSVYFRLRKRDQTGFASEWTQEIKVK